MKHLVKIQKEFLRFAKVFSSQEELDEYMRKHPGGDRRNHIVRPLKLGDEDHSSGQSRIFTEDGWKYFDQDDDGKKDFEEEKNRIKSFLKGQQ